MSGKANGREFNIDGSLVVITGGNSGIGMETARKLSWAGAAVVLACRNMEKAEAAKKNIENDTGNPVKIMKVDLSSFSSIRLFTEKLLDKYGVPDVLINNAGVFCRKPSVAESGIETTVAVNYFAPFLLTGLLLPHMDSINAETRIVNVSSESYYAVKFELAAFKKGHYRYFNAYSISKRALMYYTFELAQKLAGSGITVNSVNPGHAATGIWPSDKWYWRLVNKLTALRADPISYAADNVVYAASSLDLSGKTGLYISNMKPVSVRNNIFDNKIQKDLWNYTVAELKRFGEEI